MMDTQDSAAPGVLLLLKSPIIRGIAVGHRRSLEDFVRAVDSIGIKPVIDKTFSLDAFPAALDHLDQGAFGQVVFKLG